MEITRSLREQGIELSIVDNKLKVEPRELITPEILETIKANKARIAEELKAVTKKPDNGQSSFWLINGQAEPIPPEEITLMKKLPCVCLKDLPPAALLIYSRVLGEHIWLVTSPDLIERLQATGEVVYMLEEIARLIEQGLTDSESIKAVHAVRQEFPGSCIQ